MYPTVTESILEFAGKRYSVTPEDVLWLARAVEAESLDDEKPLDDRRVAQTLVNCFCLIASEHRNYTLTRFVRQYAQPVNPRWYPGGDLHLKWAARGQDIAAKAAARRDVHSVRNDFGWECVDAVDRALIEGPVDIPRNCTDYAAKWIDASHKYEPLTDPVRGENRLWTRAPGWQGYTVFQWQREV